MRAMKTEEVAFTLNKSSVQVRRYQKNGLLKATRHGKEWLFDYDDVLEFARSRGIHPQEERSLQGENFTFKSAQEYLQSRLIRGVNLTVSPTP